jgi:hypothetical protein
VLPGAAATDASYAMNRAPWLQSVGAFTLSRVLGFARSSRFIGLPSGHFSETVGQSIPSTGGAAAGAELSAAEELGDKQVRFPFPQWALEGNSPRAWILANAVRGGAGAGIGVFRGHFSEVILSALAALPRRDPQLRRNSLQKGIIPAGRCPKKAL